jgi:hypothetical protein
MPHSEDPPLKISPHNQQMLLQNEGISILGNMPIGLFKMRNDGLGNLSVSPCSKSRNGRRVIWDHRRGEHKSPPYPLNVSPTSHCRGPYSRIEDYELKERITVKISGAGRRPLDCRVGRIVLHSHCRELPRKMK